MPALRWIPVAVLAATVASLTGCVSDTGRSEARTTTEPHPPAPHVRLSPGLLARARALRLTGDVPRRLRAACTGLDRRLAAEGTPRRVRCPPLVPTGPLRVRAAPLAGVRPGRPGRSYWLDVHSPVLVPGDHGGHWLVASGTRSGLRIAGLVDLVAAPAETVRIAGVRVTVRPLLPAPQGGVNAGHVTVEWSAGSTIHLVSLHGARNRARALLMAEAMIHAGRS